MKIKDIMLQLSKGMDNYSVAELSKQFKPIAKKMLLEHPSAFKTAGVDDKTISTLPLIKTFNKTALKTLCSLPFISRPLFDLWKTYLDPEVAQLWDMLIFEKHLGETEIKNRIETSIRKKSPGGSNWYIRASDHVKTEFFIFKITQTRAWDKVKFILSIPYELRLHLKKFYAIPEEAKLIVLKDIPDTQYRYENADNTILSELSRLYLYYTQMEIQVTTKNRPKHTTLSKMKKNLNLREFFPNTNDRKLKTQKTALLAGLFVDLSPSVTISDPVKFILKVLVSEIYLKKSDTPAIILNDLKGMGYLSSYDLDGLSVYYWEFLSLLSTDGWVAFENIYNLIRFNLLPMEPVRLYSADDKLYYDYRAETHGYYSNKHSISLNRYHDAISVPYIKGTFFLFAAMGLCDIAYDEPDRTIVGKTCQSAYDELKYIRLSPLGVYAIGQTESYEPAANLQESSLVCSSEALTITLKIGDDSSGYILEPYANRVEPNRFATDTSTFLKGIKTKKELANKVKLFREVSKVDFPPNWEIFFEEMLKKVDPFEKVTEPLTVFKLPPDNKELIKLIAQDSIFKSYILKAEDFHILVPKSKSASFKKRLNEFGYLLTK